MLMSFYLKENSCFRLNGITLFPLYLFCFVSKIHSYSYAFYFSCVFFKMPSNVKSKKASYNSLEMYLYVNVQEKLLYFSYPNYFPLIL